MKRNISTILQLSGRVFLVGAVFLLIRALTPCYPVKIVTRYGASYELPTSDLYYFQSTVTLTYNNSIKSLARVTSNVIQAPFICGASERVDLLVLITSVHDHIRERNAIRETWASIHVTRRGYIRFVFVLARSHNPKLEAILASEAQQYADIIQGPFYDHYRNLTLKTIYALDWVDKYCPQARYILKTDDDVYVSPLAILDYLSENPLLMRMSMLGCCYNNISVRRDPDDKWYLSHEEYSNATFAKYCSGTGYIATHDLVSTLNGVIPRVRVFSIEDAYIGECMRTLHDRVSIVDIKGRFNVDFNKIEENLVSEGYYLTIHRVAPPDLRKLWKLRPK